nr:DEAD/DEAH box helicase family protein [Candidatus Sigynarchaeota archaeon]
MNEFPKEMQFKWPWRPYQLVVLKELDTHLQDNKLHVVAAPGSGKTILGLEVVKRLNHPTLILAPSIAIKNQWVDKLMSDFLGSKETPSWISRDIKNPSFFTTSTYQGLHVAFTGSQEALEEEAEEETAQDGGGKPGLKPFKPKVEKSDEKQPASKPSSDSKAAAPASKPVVEATSAKKPAAKKEGATVEPASEGEHAKKPKKEKSDIAAKLKAAGVRTVVVDECHHLRTAWWASLSKVIEGLDNPTIVALTATPPYDVEPAEWNRYTELCGPIDAEINVPELVKVQTLCPHQDYVFFSTPTKEEMDKIKTFESDIDTFLKNLFATKEFTALVANHRWIKQPQQHVEEILDNPAVYSSMLVYMKHISEPIPPAAIELVSGSTTTQIPAMSNYWMEVLCSTIFGDPEGVGKLPAPVEKLRKDLSKIGAIEKRWVSLNLNDKISKLLASSLSKMKSIEEIVKAEYKILGDKLRMVVLTDYIRKDMLPEDANDTRTLNKIGVVPLFETARRMNIEGVKLGALSGSLVLVPKPAGDLLKTVLSEMKIDQKLVKLTDLYYDNQFLQVEFQGPAVTRMVGIITEVFTRGGINVLVGTKSLLGEGWDAPCLNSLILATFVGSFMFSNQMRGRAIRTEKNNPNKTGNIYHLVCIMPDSATPGDDFETMTRRFKAFVGVSQAKPVIENGMARLDLPQPPFSESTLKTINERTLKRAGDRDGMRKSWDEALKKGGTTPKLVEKVAIKADFAQKKMTIQKGLKTADLEDIGIVVLRVLCGTNTINSKFTDLKVKLQKEGNELSCFLDGGTRKEQSSFLTALQELVEAPWNPKYMIGIAKGKKIDLDRVYAVPEIIGAKKEWAEYFSQKWKQEIGENELIYTRSKEGRIFLLQARTRAASAGSGDRSQLLSRWQ